MIRSTTLLLVLLASPTIGAPVPKEIRANAGHVGKWQNVYVDGKNPAVITSRGQYWYFDEDGGFTYQNAPAVGPPPKPAERMVFDPKTGHAQHSMNAPDQRIRLGYYKLDGDRLTLNLNNAPGPRPKGLEPEANSTIWHLQRVEVKK